MTHQSRPKGRGLSASALLGLSLALAAAIAPAAAEKVGVAAAVNPDAFSSLAGAPQSQLNIGKSIFFNERIATTTSGLVQVLLVDGSTFTVGPDSDLVINKFVYDPNKGTGQIAASFSKGVMRFVGGKISKSDNAVTINTPAGAMAVRGCIILTQVTPPTPVSPVKLTAILVYGDYLKIKHFVIYDPGNGYFNGEIKKATAADIGKMVAGLSSSNTQNQNGDASSETSNPGTVIQLVDTANLAELIQNANTQLVVDSAKVEVKPDVIVPPPCVGAECNPPPPPPCEGIECGSPRGQLQGYAGGVWVTQDSAPQDSVDLQSEDTDTPPPPPVDRHPEYGTLANHSAEDVSFTFNEDGDDNAENDTFSARFRLRVGEPGAPSEGGILMNFGDKQPPGEGEEPRSFINPETGGLFAFTGPRDIKIFHDNDEEGTLIGEPIAVLASSENFGAYDPEGPSPNALSHDNPELPPLPELCTDCDFLKWGVFAAAGTFEDDENQRDVGILGFWVAGDIPAVGDLPFTGSASYSGGAVGQVSTDLFGSQETYTAKGDMDMRWDFGKRSGDMRISKFDQQHFGNDGLTFRGDMCAPGVTTCGTTTPKGNHFGGKLTGQLPADGQMGELPPEARDLNGFALGSFARGPDNYTNQDPKNGTPIKESKPQGVMGNWSVGNDRYKASGVFAGTRD